MKCSRARGPCLQPASAGASRDSAPSRCPTGQGRRGGADVPMPSPPGCWLRGWQVTGHCSCLWTGRGAAAWRWQQDNKSCWIFCPLQHAWILGYFGGKGAFHHSPSTHIVVILLSKVAGGSPRAALPSSFTAGSQGALSLGADAQKADSSLQGWFRS